MASFDLCDWREDYHLSDRKEDSRLVGIEFELVAKTANEMPDDEGHIIAEDWLDEEGIGNYYDEYAEYDETDYESRAKWIQEQLQEKGLAIAGVGYDGNDKEFVTYPDSITHYHSGGSKRFKEVLDFLDKYTEVGDNSGTHIHVSKLPSDIPSTWDNIYWFDICFQKQLQKIFGRVTSWAMPFRVPSNEYKNSSDETIIEVPHKRPENMAPKDYDKHHMVVDRGNRYEFRGPKASHNINEVLAWIELCNNIVDLCSNGYIKNAKFKEVLKGKYIRKYINELNKLDNRKITEEERKQSISSMIIIKPFTLVDKNGNKKTNIIL